MPFRVVPTVLTALATACACTAPSAVAAAAAAQAAEPSPAQRELQAARTFAPALGATLTRANISRLARRDLVVVDGELTTTGEVKRLKARGALVLGYLSVGSVESWRTWFPLLKEYRLEELGDWEGESYADVSKPGARDALADRIAPDLIGKGFDGLFLDNVDMVEDHAAQQAGMLDLVTRLSSRVHAAGGVLMAQNGDSIIDPFVPLLDAWNREDPTGTYDFSKKKYIPTDTAGRRLARTTIKRLAAAGLVVTTIDYFGSPTSPQAKRAIRISCQAGALPFIGDIALKKVPKTPARC